ncbi:hypothetical protein COU76_00015 [Candidatus Peregrinibacteria bacterium CG10_big_fil_rev_8_21_14_0_10_49_10]|nr:MAG: hypothetical protein COU76_00015 [Candidatus Peregrinibacteria bacterium CG10_big_fil_rev_8_21_14_0_10_49_10]
MKKHISVIVLLAVVVVVVIVLSRGATPPSTSAPLGNTSEKTVLNVFNPGEEANLKELHDTVLARLQSETPLTGEEKSSIAVILDMVNGVSGQSDGSEIRFTDEEVEKIMKLLAE